MIPSNLPLPRRAPFFLIAGLLFAFVIMPKMVSAENTPSGPVRIILDTDIGGDIDDAGALTILNKLADFDECRILAVVFDSVNQDKSSAAAIDVINTFYGRPHIPIGTYQAKPYFHPLKSAYSNQLRDEFPHTALPDDQEPKALDVYRKALADAPDGSVKIVSIGFMINLEDLLKSGPDSFSPLSGPDLIKKKVIELSAMGGAYPVGREWNFSGDGSGPHTRYVVENWPTPILFSGAEIGGAITTGEKPTFAPVGTPVQRGYGLYNLYNHFSGRGSWDLTAVLAAVRDPEVYWTVKRDGYCKVADDGSNVWMATPHRGHSYLVMKVPGMDMVAILDNLMALPPRNHK